MEQPKIKHIPLSQMNPAPYNPRVKLVPGDPEYDSLNQCMEEFGCVVPIVWNEATGNIVAGHRRYDVLTAHGDTEADAVVVHIADSDREKTLNLALNNIRGRWDEELLLPMLADLQDKVDLTVAGFDPADVDRMIAGATLDIDAFFSPKAEKAAPPENDEHEGQIQCPHCGEWFTPPKQ